MAGDKDELAKMNTKTVIVFVLASEVTRRPGANAHFVLMIDRLSRRDLSLRKVPCPTNRYEISDFCPHGPVSRHCGEKRLVSQKLFYPFDDLRWLIRNRFSQGLKFIT